MSHDSPNQTSDLIAYVAYPHLAAALRTRIPSILTRWEAATRKLLPHAKRLNANDFRDDVPLTLQRLADALGSKRPRGLYDLEDTARVHGTSRFDQQFNMRDVITEFRLLRRIILEEVAEELNAQVEIGEMIEMSMATDAAFQETILTFVDHQRDQIQASAEAESKFLSFLSHDLRNHLNHATLSLEDIRLRLRSDPRYADDAQALQSVQNSIFETLHGMERLLQSERLRKGNVPLKKEPVNLRNLVQQVLQPFENAAAKKGLEFQVEVGDFTFDTDPHLLTLVLQNLVGNAAKYTAKGFIKITAESSSHPSGQACTISVIDSGPGIPHDQFKTLFDAFTRGATHGQPGLGLGLAIASQAAKLLDATLHVESTPGQGATFRLKLKRDPIPLSTPTP